MHLRSAGLESERDFLRACALEDERLAAGWGPFWGYTWQGRYGAHLAHLLSTFAREQVLVLVYRELRNDPAATLHRVCEFLGVSPGVVTDVPAANVTAAAGSGRAHDALSAVLRHAVDVLPHAVSGPLERALLRRLQRDQHLREPLTAEQRAALLPAFLDDIALLEDVSGRSFAHWRDVDNGRGRPGLPVSGRIGTAHNSIDRPVAP
jgi:hypothetical protein